MDLKGHTVEELAAVANVTVDVIQEAIKMRQQQMLLDRRNYASQLKQQISNHITTPATTTVRTTQPTTTTQRTTTSEPRRRVSKYAVRGGHKVSQTTQGESLSLLNSTRQVMNAPREYYPVGYDKNFDDNFKSKVDLPETNFHCGDQKHFPGLYADEDLGCMVS